MREVISLLGIINLSTKNWAKLQLSAFYNSEANYNYTEMLCLRLWTSALNVSHIHAFPMNACPSMRTQDTWKNSPLAELHCHNQLGDVYNSFINYTCLGGYSFQ